MVPMSMVYTTSMVPEKDESETPAGRCRMRKILRGRQATVLPAIKTATAKVRPVQAIDQSRTTSQLRASSLLQMVSRHCVMACMTLEVVQSIVTMVMGTSPVEAE